MEMVNFILHVILIFMLITCFALVSVIVIMLVDYMGYDIPEWLRKLKK